MKVHVLYLSAFFSPCYPLRIVGASSKIFENFGRISEKREILKMKILAAKICSNAPTLQQNRNYSPYNNNKLLINNKLIYMTGFSFLRICWSNVGFLLEQKKFCSKSLLDDQKLMVAPTVGAVRKFKHVQRTVFQ